MCVCVCVCVCVRVWCVCERERERVTDLILTIIISLVFTLLLSVLMENTDQRCRSYGYKEVGHYMVSEATLQGRIIILIANECVLSTKIVKTTLEQKAININNRHTYS